MTESPPVDWDEVERDFRSNGFLAPSMPVFREHFLTKFSEWFELTRELNMHAQELYVGQTDLLKGKSTLDPVALGLQLMPRALAGFQGAILLIEYGMTTEAKSLARQVHEAAFWMGYLHKDPANAVDHLQHDTLTGEAGFFRSALDEPDLDEETRTAVEAQLDDLERARAKLQKAPRTEQIATAAGYGGAYLHFRHLSGGAVHASLKSIFGYLSRDVEGGIKGHQIGPDEDGAPEALYMACFGLILAIDALVQLTGFADAERSAAIQRLFNRVGVLSGYDEVEMPH